MTNSLLKKIPILKNIPKIIINPFFWVIIIGALLTGQFIEIITLFGIIFIHELGHLFAAESYGWAIKEIQLLPFGGVAHVEPKTDSIKEDLIVAISGPLQNLLMIIIAFGFEKVHLWSSDWTVFFIKANIIIAIFNLIPISPLDGKRILLNFLFLFFPVRKSLMMSIFISIVLTLVFLAWSLGFMNEFKINLNGLLLTVFFVYNNYMDIKNTPYQFWRFLLKRLENGGKKRSVAAVPIIIDKNVKLINALRLLRKGKYHLYYLLSEDGEIISILPEEKLLKYLTHKKEIYQPISKLIT